MRKLYLGIALHDGRLFGGCPATSNPSARSGIQFLREQPGRFRQNDDSGSLNVAEIGAIHPLQAKQMTMNELGYQ
jgi:hypothetical protein